MLLVGRDVECDQLERMLSATHGGHGAGLVLRGDPGVGKSALLEFAASALDFRVVHRAAWRPRSNCRSPDSTSCAPSSSNWPLSCRPRNRPPSESRLDSAAGRPRSGSSSVWRC